MSVYFQQRKTSFILLIICSAEQSISAQLKVINSVIIKEKCYKKYDKINHLIKTPAFRNT